MNNPLRRLHPLVAVAAVAVTLLSLVGIAAMLGWVPAANSSSAVASNGPEAKQSGVFSLFKKKCENCGTVENVTTRTIQGQGSGVGAVVGGVLGGVLGNQVGGGRGKDAATVVGAVGGAYAGNEIEKQNKRYQRYVVSVRLDEGGTRSFTFTSPPAWRAGDRVRVEGDALVRAS